MKWSMTAMWDWRVAWVAIWICAALLNWIVAFGCERAGEARSLQRRFRVSSYEPESWFAPFDEQSGKRERRALAAIWPFQAPEGWPAVPARVSGESIGSSVATTASSLDTFGAQRSWMMQRRDFGWPWRSVWRGELITLGRNMTGFTRASRASWTVPQSAAKVLGVSHLPLGVRPVGFVANTAVYAVVLGVLAMVPGRVRGWWRVRRGRCRACAYPVGVSPVCTECGAGVRAGK